MFNKSPIPPIFFKKDLNALVRFTSTVLTPVIWFRQKSTRAISLANQSPISPPVNREMRALDRSFFKKQITVIAAVFQDPTFLSKFTRHAKNDYLQLSGVNHIINLPLENGETTKAVLLRHDIDNLNDVPSKVSKKSLEILQEAKALLTTHTLSLDYNHWRADEILHAILPECLHHEIPTGFTTVGHIAHLNVRNEYLPYKNLIGEVIMDKNPRIRTVVNKLDSIDSKFRTFSMEVLAGENLFQVEQNESNCKFQFDFRKVYWNSRLHTEHGRLINQFKPGSAVCDVFSGVGPFAIPAGKNRVFVFANDLNPESYKALMCNITLNKTSSFVNAFNLDGAQFIKISPHLLLDYANKEKFIELPIPKVHRTSHNKDGGKLLANPVSMAIPKVFDHYVMNLPGIAIDFLTAFRGLYLDERLSVMTKEEGFQFPIIHVHCFHKATLENRNPSTEEAILSLKERISQSLGYDIPISALSTHYVRKVAPTKDMYCVSFRLPREVAFATLV
ncbi:hypothetical protein NADFUDRAFT_25650 [Nadsonia fulvescens var. elongata DSM 6958]|uniref:tRNA (guanine(37)-N1)-methyltransferase n=1 Tax=Nadsonia fulvescens var. elongata DSM 6958 TaxID=857566 RepID=A0A1E3PIJ1_9ASCO|nr:hypothetical protein NADFUDRAFT_25650 [Nadsonia fulvescens var. elongata DSM 6958]